ncbi:MAG: efflux RND transporter periplasmic adaptor subunit [Candidatus Acidiferrales bacterium]
MRVLGTERLALALALCASVAAASCGEKASKDPEAGAPPPAQVESVSSSNLVQVDDPAQFPLTVAVAYDSPMSLVANGVVSPDISRTVPVVSLAAGRVVEIKARLGDTVKKGQVLLRVQSADIASAFSDYRKAVADQTLAEKQLDRAKGLYDHGAIALNDLQVAQDTAAKAAVDVETTTDHLRLLGADPSSPSPIVNIVAPISGVITDQQVTNAAGVAGLGSANPFTISDLSSVWILCDVYENDLPSIKLGDTADIRVNGYPDRVLKGRVSNIGAVLDPNLRSAKVRVEVANPGFLKVGMFVTATFVGQKSQQHAAVPDAAILHLHDRDWVYVPAGDKKFRKVAVTTGKTLPNKMQEIIAGVKAGDQVVSNALVLQNTVEQ